MRKLLWSAAFLLVIPGFGYAQFDAQRFKKEVPAFETAINGVVDAVFPGYGLKEKARAAYLEGYGPVFSLVIQLEMATNPFTSPLPPAEVKKNSERRYREIKVQMADLLRQKSPKLLEALDSGAVSVVVDVYDSNPVYVPDLPTQVVFTAKKVSAGVDVAVHEYNFDASRK